MLQLFYIDLAAVQNKVLAASNSAVAKRLSCIVFTTYHFEAQALVAFLIYTDILEIQTTKVAKHRNFLHSDVLASFTVARFVWSSKSWHHGFGTRCPQSPPAWSRRHVTCTGSATMQYCILCLHAHGSSSVVAGESGRSCANSTVHRKQEKSKDFNIKLLCVSFAAASCKGRQKEKQRTKPHTRLAVLLKRHREDEVWRDGPTVSRSPCDKRSSHTSL